MLLKMIVVQFPTRRCNYLPALMCIAASSRSGSRLYCIARLYFGWVDPGANSHKGSTKILALETICRSLFFCFRRGLCFSNNPFKPTETLDFACSEVSLLYITPHFYSVCNSIFVSSLSAEHTGELEERITICDLRNINTCAIPHACLNVYCYSDYASRSYSHPFKIIFALA